MKKSSNVCYTAAGGWGWSGWILPGEEPESYDTIRAGLGDMISTADWSGDDPRDLFLCRMLPLEPWEYRDELMPILEQRIRERHDEGNTDDEFYRGCTEWLLDLRKDVEKHKTETGNKDRIILYKVAHRMYSYNSGTEWVDTEVVALPETADLGDAELRLKLICTCDCIIDEDGDLDGSIPTLAEAAEVIENGSIPSAGLISAVNSYAARKYYVVCERAIVTVLNVVYQGRHLQIDLSEEDV